MGRTPSLLASVPVLEQYSLQRGVQRDGQQQLRHFPWRERSEELEHLLQVAAAGRAQEARIVVGLKESGGAGVRR